MKAAGPAKEINARPEAEAFSIVGVGASARGLKAFIELTGALGEKTGMAFVLVQHLDPKHPSILPELIAKAARIPVLEVKDGVKVEPDHIYVIPPNTSMEVSRGVLSLLPRKSGRSGYLPIDHFFHSLAEDAGTRAIGVILSGTASDGAAGLNHIKASGGITFAQSPESAEYDGMPRSAIAAGAADSVLPPAEIAAELARIASHPNFAVPPVAGSELTRESEGSFLRRVLFILRQARGVNFAEYKSTTLWRRIHRRMVINRSETPNDYLRLLQASPAEAEALYQDFLITVTRFFRDPGAFEALRQLAFPEIMKKKLSEAPVRLWVPGCSTGEEAYSLAISVLEFLETSGRSHPVQIFATDINDRALETARAGVYAEGLARDVSAERLRRYFTRTDGGWQVIKSLRELCIFARQDVTRDPPFSRMDLISFRNVLIYLGTSMQKKLLPVMHYALLPGGYLLLGSSESVDGFKDLFGVADKKSRLYRRQAVPARVPLEFHARGADAEGLDAPRGEPAPAARAPAFNALKEADSIVLDRFGLPGVLIDEDQEILQFRGNMGPYISPSQGKASFNILSLVRRDLTADLRTAIDKARRGMKPVRAECLPDPGAGGGIVIEVVPFKAPEGDFYALVLFDERTRGEMRTSGREGSGAGRPGKRGAKGDFIRLEKELAAAREALQSLMDEKERAVEELGAANEENQSGNEELQSINEELETAKEELQSTNEELTTVNEELQNRNVELVQVNDDLGNLLNSVHIPILMLSKDLKIRRFTKAADRLLNLIPTDLGRPVGDINLKLHVPDFEAKVLEVIETLNSREEEIRDFSGRWYSMQLRPYRTSDGRIDGAVISLLDIHELKQSLGAAEEARNFARAITETVREPFIVLDGEMRVRSANHAFYRAFRTTPGETEGRLFQEIGEGRWDIPELRDHMKQVLESRIWLKDFEAEFVLPGSGRKTMLLNARGFMPEGVGEKMALLAFDDITSRKRALESLKESELKYRALFDYARDGIVLVDAQTGRIGECNLEFEKLAGRPQKQLRKMKIWDLRPPHKRVAAREMFQEIVEAGFGGSSELEYQRPDGTIVPVEFTSRAIEIAGTRCIQSIVRDIAPQRRARELMEAQVALGQLINSTLDFSAVIDRVAEACCLAFGCESTFILFQGKEGWAGARFNSASKRLEPLHLADGEVAAFIPQAGGEQGTAVIEDSLDDAGGAGEFLGKYGIRSCVLAPLVVKGQVSGVLVFAYHSKKTSFSPEEVAFTSDLALALSGAAENARLYEAQARIADTMQQVLLTVPGRIAGVEHGYLYRSASHSARVGGDFYDIFELEPGKVMIALGDVAGHGLEASVMAVLARNVLKAYAYEGGAPKTIMARANDVVVKRSENDYSLITAFLALLDVKTGRFRYCSAGHPPGAVRRKTGEMFFLPHRNYPLGIVGDVRYAEGEETLKQGDFLFLYTDGVTEARRGREFFGEERMLAFLRGVSAGELKRFPAVLMSELVEFTGGNLMDDVAMMAVALGSRRAQ